MRTIEPLDKTFTPPEVVSDRSDVVKKVYESPLKSVDIAGLPPEKILELTLDTRRKLHYKDTLLINLLVVVPYILSFVAITAIFALPAGTDMATVASNRMVMILWTIPALFPWVFALFKLRSELWNTNLGFSAFLLIYSLLILPVLDVSITLQERGVPSFIFLSVTFVLSQIYLASIVHALLRKAIPFAPILIIASLVFAAIVV